MRFEFFDRQFFDLLIYFVFGTGVIAALIRLYRDFTRPLPSDEDKRSSNAGEDTQADTRPRPPQNG